MFLFNVQHIHRNFDSCQSQHSALCKKPASPVSTRVQNHHIWVILLSTRPSTLCRLHLVWSLVSSYSLTINQSFRGSGRHVHEKDAVFEVWLLHPLQPLLFSAGGPPEQLEHAGGVQRGGRTSDNSVNPRCWRDSLCKTSLDCTSLEQSQCSQSAEKGRRGKSAIWKRLVLKSSK